jgi:hypothetical protein
MPAQDGGIAPPDSWLYPVDAQAAFATDEPGIYEMATDASYLYWVDNGQFDHEANVRRMPLDGGPIQTLYSTTERIYSLAVAGGYVYAAHTGAQNQGQIYRIPASGGVATVIATGFNPTSVSVDGSWVYYSEAVSPGGRILRVPTTGGTPEVVVGDADNPWDLVADEGVLYYSEMNRGRMMRVVPGNTPVVLASGWVGTGWMALDAEHVYFTACDQGQCTPTHLFRVPRDGGTVESLVDGSCNECKISVAGNIVQWGTLLVEASSHHQHVVPGAGHAIAVAATPSANYFGDFFTGAIFRSP